MYNSTFAGAKAISNNGAVATDYPGSTALYKYGDGKKLTLTGQYEIHSHDDGTYTVYFLATNGDWICQYLTATRAINTAQYPYFWEFEELNIPSSANNSSSQADAQTLLNRIIADNKRIYENNLICRRFASKLTAQQQQMLTYLQTNLEIRDKEIKDSGTANNIKVSVPNYLKQYTSSTYDVAGIATTIIVSAVVITAVSAAAIYFYKGLLKEAEQDVKYSDELTKALVAKLTPEEYEQLKKETAGIITKQALRQRFSGAASATKLLVFAALAVLAIPLIKKNVKEIKKKA